MSKASHPVCWTISDGRAGVDNQARGLAQAVAEITPLEILSKKIVVREPWRSLPPWLWGNALEKLGVESDLFAAPWPDLIIATGRLSVPVSLEIKKRHAGSFIVQTQNPKFAHGIFDLIIPPIHDGLAGENVFPILGAPNLITAKFLDDETKKLEGQFPDLKRPVVSVIIGGPNKAFEMSEDWAAQFAKDTLSAVGDCDLMVTFSRRTPASIVKFFEDAFRAKALLIFDPMNPDSSTEEVDNPYPGLLGIADIIIVTCDSVNMITEAATAGRSIYIADLPEKENSRKVKFQQLHDAVENCGASKKWRGEIETWTYMPLRETARAAEEIVRRLRLR